MIDPCPCSPDDGTRQRNSRFNHCQLRDSETAKFVAVLVPQIIKAIAAKLLALLPNIPDQQCAARLVQAFFWKELGHHEPPNRDVFEPSFRATRDGPETHKDMAVLQSKVAAIQVPALSRLNLIGANIAKLTAMLNLDSIEAKLLAWSYALHRSDNDELRELAYLIRFNDHAHKVHQLSLLFDEPVEEVEPVLKSPCRMLALRFVDANAWHESNRLSDLLAVTQETLGLIETEHRSCNGMLTYLLEPEFDADLIDKEHCTSAGLYESYPQAVAEAYELARRERPLNINQLPAIIHWFTLMEIPREQVQLFEFRLEALRECLKRCFVACGQANRTVTQFLLLKALYAAA